MCEGREDMGEGMWARGYEPGDRGKGRVHAGEGIWARGYRRVDMGEGIGVK